MSWKEYCRPVIGLDGTFLKHSSLQGMILTVIGRDLNNQIYPIAWAGVNSERNDNCQWFIHRLKIDLDLGMGDLVTMISDQHKGFMELQLQLSFQELNIEPVLGTSTLI